MSFAAQALTHRRYRRRHVLALLLLVLLVAWAGFWGIVAVHFNNTIDTWVETAKASGAPLTFAKRTTDGTPFTVHIHLDHFHYAQADALELQADEAVLYLSLWDWSKITTKLRNNIQGKISGLPFSAEVLKFGFAYPERAPINDMETGISVWAQTLGLTLKPQEPLALGNRLSQLSFDLRVMGTPPDFTKRESVQAWSNASGVIEFDQLDLAWASLGVSAKGTMAFTTDLQPEGAFSGKVDGLNDTIETLVTKGLIEQRQQAILRSSISVLSRPSSALGASAPIVPISIQGGGLYLGPVRILTIPTVSWPESTPTS